jgi:hypothetical protein
MSYSSALAHRIMLVQVALFSAGESMCRAVSGLTSRHRLLRGTLRQPHSYCCDR